MSKASDNEAFVRKIQEALSLTVDGWAGDVTTRETLKSLGRPLAPTPVTVSTLDARSEERLKGVDARLARTVRRAAQLSSVPFMVVEGLRTAARQAELYAQGRTKPGKVVTWTLKSKHLDGLAVDLAPIVNGKIDWNDLAKFDVIYRAMMLAASENALAIRYGGDWDGDGKLREKGETDSPHFEIRA
jgi:peptidoglycan LD-endopeptidase CwlK